MSETTNDTPGILAPPPFLFLGFLLIGIALEHWVVKTKGLDMPGSLSLTVVIVFVLSGVALLLSAWLGFRAANTPALPWKPSTAFVAKGVFRFTRNPMYLGMALIYLALAVAADAPVALWLFVPLIMTVHYGVIVREERYMAGKFGVPYINYAHSVPRWL